MKITRRAFVQTSAALAAAPFLPHVEGRDEIRVGLVGCGGRGSGAALQALKADKSAVLVAMADAFGDRLDRSLGHLTKAAAAQVRVADDHKFVGLDSGERLIASGVDVVLLASPPVFRPAHLRLAVEAGKHVFCEKPVAVDGPGIRSVLESVRISKEKKLSLVSGFCWRYSAPHRENFKRLHDGAIGKIVAVYTTYNTTPLNTHPRKPEWTPLDFQVRNWQHFTWLSGDHIAEQAVHSIDKMLWAMNGELPVRATAVGGRQAREGEETGNVYDHFSVTYEFKSGAPGFHMCRQIANCSNDNSDLIIGDKGTCEITSFNGKHVITGPNAWKWRSKGDENDMYQQELDELFASIRKGEAKNDGALMADGTIAAILGRMAAYTGQTLTWEQAVNSQESLLPAKLDPAAPPPVTVAIPGRTKFT
jgi:myo-inositol 2-dehydrogenase / D-chiro-inositol 1-dehydrogenase